MNVSDYRPCLELTRGEVVESIHFGAIAVVDTAGRLVAWYGNANTCTYLRSTASPFKRCLSLNARDTRPTIYLA
jgi:L-asparaginase II